MAVYKNKKSPSTQIILKINPRKSLTPSVTGLQRRIVQKFGSIHTLNNIGFLPQWSLAGSLLFARSNRVYEGNKIEWKDNFSHRMEKRKNWSRNWSNPNFYREFFFSKCDSPEIFWTCANTRKTILITFFSLNHPTPSTATRQPASVLPSLWLISVQSELF